VVLAKKCIAANIPSTIVAQLLNVSRQTVHAWFRGGKIQSDRIDVIEALIKIIDKDTATGALPLKDYKSSKSYYNSLIGPLSRVLCWARLVRALIVSGCYV